MFKIRRLQTGCPNCRQLLKCAEIGFRKERIVIARAIGVWTVRLGLQVPQGVITPLPAPQEPAPVARSAVA